MANKNFWRVHRDGKDGAGLVPIQHDVSDTAVEGARVPLAHTAFVDTTGQFTAGVWACDAETLKIRNLAVNEACYLIEVPLGLLGSALGEAVTVTIHLKDVDEMGEAVKQGACQTFSSDGFRPFIEGQIAGDQCGAALIASGDHLEQQFCPSLAERDKAEFVDDQKLASRHLLLQAQQPSFITGFPSVHARGLLRW